VTTGLGYVKAFAGGEVAGLAHRRLKAAATGQQSKQGEAEAGGGFHGGRFKPGPTFTQARAVFDKPTRPRSGAGMDDLVARMRADLEEIGRPRMPFGKYGPAAHPPEGLPIYDLPAEYLGWFAGKAGFPKGRL